MTHLTLPLSAEQAASLRAGEQITLSGPIYAARDAAHRRMAAALAAGEPLPIPLAGASIYYVGPTPPRPGAVVGAAGPTTAVRMDPFTPALLAAGLRLMIGKGGRGPEVRQAIMEHGAVYSIAIGGAGALLSQHITEAAVVAWPDLGTEAIRLLTFDHFPVIIACDAAGGDQLSAGKAAWRRIPGPP